jgi:tetratricopeptide (TPR) repeat protein
MVWNILAVVFGVATLGSIVLTIRESRRATRAEKRLIEIQKLQESYDYLKTRAFVYYNQGNYEQSIDVFKRYLVTNKDVTIWQGIISDILIAETRKIFDKKFKEAIFMPANITAFMVAEAQFKDAGKYSAILLELAQMYEKNFGKFTPLYRVITSLVNGDWQGVAKYAESYGPFSDKEMNENFQNVIKRFCKLKQPARGDFPEGDSPEGGFHDDIPF